MARLGIIAALLSGALVSTCAWGWAMVDHAGDDARALLEARDEGCAATFADQAIEDAPAERSTPIYMQTDERWGGLPYAGADLATSGCGLTCAAMAWEYLSGLEWTPVQMLNAVGNSCTQGGQNYMPGFCEWMKRQDPSLDYTVLYESVEHALVESASGRMVFGTMSGSLTEGGREYGGHVVLITENLYGHITIHDPCEAYALSVTHDEFNAVAWDYFISIGRE